VGGSTEPKWITKLLHVLFVITLGAVSLMVAVVYLRPFADVRDPRVFPAVVAASAIYFIGLYLVTGALIRGLDLGDQTSS